MNKKIEKVLLKKELLQLLEKYYEAYNNFYKKEITDTHLRNEANLNYQKAEIGIINYVDNCFYRSYLPGPIYDFFLSSKEAMCINCMVKSWESDMELCCLLKRKKRAYTIVNLAYFCEQKIGKNKNLESGTNML